MSEQVQAKGGSMRRPFRKPYHYWEYGGKRYPRTNFASGTTTHDDQMLDMQTGQITKRNPTAESLVAVMLEDTSATKRHAIGTEVEKEHTSDPKKASEIARTHEKENPLYYPPHPKPKGAKEALRWVKARPKPKMSFYPSMGGPSSM